MFLLPWKKIVFMLFLISLDFTKICHTSVILLYFIYFLFGVSCYPEASSSHTACLLRFDDVWCLMLF